MRTQVGIEGDESGKQYRSRNELWQQEAQREGARGKLAFYEDAIDYWSHLPATDETVMGGNQHLHSIDCSDSIAFLRTTLAQMQTQREAEQCAYLHDRLTALDCGAGVGRVTHGALLHCVHEVDLVEPVASLLDEAKRRLVQEDTMVNEATKHAQRCRYANRFYYEGLEEFFPPQGRYDIIWIQWCIGHLTDDDMLQFLQRCKQGLKHRGRIIVKENTSNHDFVVDRNDSSVTRGHNYFRDMFAAAGLALVRTAKQSSFPGDLHAVRMYELSVPLV